VRAAARRTPNWHEIGTDASPTRNSDPGNVAPEGGGTEHPTLGGGIGFSREQETVPEAGVR
jgi:hypothetical protein